MFRPQIRLCLYTKSLTTIDTAREVPASIPCSGKGFMFDLLFYCCCFFCVQNTHYLSQKFKTSFAMLIYLVYIARCVTDL